MSTYTTETVNAQFLNSSFIDRIEAGHTKEASEVLSTFTRQKLRETGFARKIFTPQSIVASDLDRDIDETPRILVEKEPDSTAAAFGLHGSPEIRYWSAKRYPVYFFKVSSPDFRKTKGELMTYKHNIQQILQENSIKDLQTQEDGNLVDRLKAIAADTASGNAGIQDYSVTGFGIKTLTHFYGFEIITTIKGDLLSSNATAGISDNDYSDMIFVFAPEQYLGQFFSLIEPTVFVKTEADVIEFQTYEYVGIGLGNTKGFVGGKYNHSVDADLAP